MKIMEGLKPNTNLLFLKDKVLSQININLGQILLVFDDDISISIESCCSVILAGIEWKVDNYKDESGVFTKLIGSQIEQSGVLEDGGMFVGLTNGDRINIYNSNVYLESFQIIKGGEVIVA